IINSYGVTEATIDSTYYESKSNDGDGAAEFVPIGRPMANVKCFIFDVCGRMQPVGVPGELVISGSGIARGYANRPELTSEKFRPQMTPITKIEKAKIIKSFSGGPGGRFYKKAPLVIYKTGDLARWVPDNTARGTYIIEFLGRIDYQVKIRGFRIELGEIENRLLEHEMVKDAVVIDHTDASGDKLLAAYISPIVKKSGEVIDKLQLTENIREYLTGKLPGYMIPSYFILVEKLPLTSNGKIDRKSLPPLVENSFAETIEYIAPRSAIEIKLAALWSHILDIKQGGLGIDADFFRLGGHSLKITRLAAGINRELGLNISLTELFKLTTIRAQARYLEEIEQQKQKEESIPLQPAPVQEYYDLSYAQRRLWIICQFEEDSIAYNEVGGLAIKGKFNPTAFEKAIRTIAQRHEILRTIFVTVAGEPKQKILPEVELKLEQTDLRHLKEKGDRQEKIGEIEEKGDRQEIEAALIIKNTANKAFNLETGPLAVFKLLRLEDERYFLLVNIHHIINDGWSVGVIKKELNTLYNYFNKNLPGEPPLAPVTFQYKDYTLWHNRLITGGYF
ncbi:MAG TPA: condensation domain-containing protein, partial [Candidatus Deferrimicrobium sp.]|nr:condensation domain-containing protein [Candidatus Deferrimicrobium sp.]